MTFRYSVFLLRLAASLVVVAATTLICTHVIAVNALTAGFAYLLGILAIAATWGLIESVIASVAAMLCFNFFFLPPVGMFTIADPQNWVALFAFLATALVASHLSNREKKQAAEATRRQRETEQLYALSRSILLTDPSQSVGSQAARHISEIFDCPGVALYDVKTSEVFRGGADDLPGIEAKLKQVAVQGNNFVEPPLFVASILLGGQPVGSLALKGSSLSDGALQALLNLVAIGLERVRTEEVSNRAEAARQSEQFKSTLLDAIAHEFKTPLTSIKAASTSLLADSPGLTPESCELVSIIDEETDRMSQLVTEAVRMSQIDAGKLRLERESLDVAELLRRVLEHFALHSAGRTIRVNTAPNLPRISADPDLLSLALRQLVDNALKYSPPASPINVVADLEGDRVVIRVHDRGPGIPEREREKIFEKFYRRDGAKGRLPGTGMGLYIAREILRAHGGDIWIEGETDEGSEFCAGLPLSKYAPKEGRTK
ncbi:MAG TPA: ATP-binding protein [Bryobacteraceae bacterium]|nr:ATP-binding protein [Bryobacteraceae bacterium]